MNRISTRVRGRSGAATILGALVAAALGGCNGSSGIPNLQESAPPLEALAVYTGPRMNDPRYSHTVTTLPSGEVLVVGGTDEQHLTAFDTVEIFDQSARVDIGEPIPESIAGDFIDQDIDGNLITMSNGGRFFHTATEIDGNVLIIGGTSSIDFGISIEPSEVYDSQTRSFGVISIDPNNDIADARARHSAYRLANGQVIVTGGQEATTIVVPSGIQGINLAIPARASTETVEIFDPATLTFSPATDTTGLPAELTTSRGRAGHTTAQWAGFDNLLNTNDDVYGFVGGFMTLSALSLAAPETYYPWNLNTTKLTSMDFYDPVSGTMNLATGLVLAVRVNDPYAINLGADRSLTPFGDPGLTNAVWLCNGDSDTPCPDPLGAVGTNFPSISELVVATFTGFGPANGVRFTSVPGETMVNLAPLFSPPPAISNTFANCHELAIQGCAELARSEAPAILMDMVRTYDGQPTIASVVVTGGGYHYIDRDACIEIVDGACFNELRGFQFYDPFYDIANVGNVLPLDDDLDDDGTPDVFPWDFADNATNLNPLGLRGAVLLYDEAIPTGETIQGYADGTDTVFLKQARVMHSLSRIPGEDGLLGSVDDRIVVIGGSNVYIPTYGDDAIAPSCEIFLPPDAGELP